MIDMRAGLGGGSGFKINEVPAPVNLTGSTAGVIYTLNPGVGNIARLNYLAILATSGTATNITVKFGTRIVINNKTVGSIFGTSAQLFNTVGRGNNTLVEQIEGLEGEILTIEAGATVSNPLHVGAVVGSYK